MNIPLNHPLPILELDVLRTFVAIAETGSFTAAAGIVFRTPSAVSMQIKKLEQMLGRTLFERDARSVSITADGELLLAYARRMLALNREAVSQFIAPDVSGMVRLGAPDDVGERVLPTVLKRFADTHPAISVDVLIDQSTDLQRRYEGQRLDITLVTCTDNTNRHPDLEIVLTEPLVWAGLKGGCAHLQTPVPVSMWEDGCAWRAGAQEALDAVEKSYRVAYMSAHTAGQRAAILSDLAIAPLPESCVDDKLVALGPQDGLPRLGSYHLGMLIRADAPPHVKAVADHFRATFDDFRRTGHY